MTEPTTGSARRERTRAQLLESVSVAGTITRLDLCRATGLSRSAVAQAVSALLDEGLVEEVVPPRTGTARRGRPSTVIRVVTPQCTVLGIDIGVRHVHVAVGDQNGLIVAEQRDDLETPCSPDEVLDYAVRLARRILVVAGIEVERIGAIVAGVPDPLEWPITVDGGATPDLDWFRLALEERLRSSVEVTWSVDLGAQGERTFGRARGHCDFVYVRLSHGVSAGLFINDELFKGGNGNAGRIGHTQLPDAMNWCRCGNRGCLNTVVSVEQIRAQLERTNVRMDECAVDLSLRLLSDHPIAARVITEAGRALGRVLADVCNVVDPELIVLGGEVGTTGTPLVVGVREVIQRNSPSAAAIEIVTSALDNRAEVLGAVSAAAGLARRSSTRSSGAVRAPAAPGPAEPVRHTEATTRERDLAAIGA